MILVQDFIQRVDDDDGEARGRRISGLGLLDKELRRLSCIVQVNHVPVKEEEENEQKLHFPFRNHAFIAALYFTTNARPTAA